MLPPVDPVVLSANPKFDALFNDLCKNKLNPDGSSRLDTKAQREHNTLSEVRNSVFNSIFARRLS